MKPISISKVLTITLSIALFSVQQVLAQEGQPSIAVGEGKSGPASEAAPVPTPFLHSTTKTLSSAFFSTESPTLSTPTSSPTADAASPDSQSSPSSSPLIPLPIPSAPSTSGNSKRIPTKTIIAASVGGGVGLLLILAFAIFMLSRQRRKLNIPGSIGRRPSLGNLFGSSRGGDSRGGPYREMGFESTSHLPIYNQFATMRNYPGSSANTPIYAEFAVVQGPPASYSPSRLNREFNGAETAASSTSRLAVPGVGYAV